MSNPAALVFFEWSDDEQTVARWVKKAVVALTVVALAMGLWTSERGGTIRHRELHGRSGFSHLEKCPYRVCGFHILRLRNPVIV